MIIRNENKNDYFEVEEFDKLFAKKIKKRQDGQLV